MALPAENTLETAQNLTTAGIDRATADAIAKAIHRSHAHLATKDDLLATRNELRHEMKGMQNQINGMQAKQTDFLTKEYLDEALERVFEKAFQNVLTKAEFAAGKQEFAESQKEMQRQFITWMLVGMGLMGSLMGGIFALVMSFV